MYPKQRLTAIVLSLLIWVRGLGMHYLKMKRTGWPEVLSDLI